MSAPTASERALAFERGIAHAGRFFMGDSNVHKAMTKLIDTVDIDVLLTRDGLATLKGALLGHGYLEKFPGSKGLRDTENGVEIDVLIAGDYPGDGKPKPVRFPDPAIAIRGPHGAFLPLVTLIELKIASGLSAPHRLKDLADVLELIRATKLERETVATLDPSVRDKFLELWQAAQTVDED